MVPLLAAGRVGTAAGLVGIAWLSDFFDGRAARASGSPTRLGPFDLAADTAVGAGLVLGFAASGWIPWWTGLAVVALLGIAFTTTGNEAFSMLLQASGYAMLLWRTWTERLGVPLAWLVGIIAVIGVVNRRIFWERSIPTFLGGVAKPFRGWPRA